MEPYILERLGLSAGEIKVYNALLKNGKARLSKLHEQTGIERRNLYDIINKLIEKGLVAYTSENKKRTFHLTNPQRLVGYVQEQEEELKNLKKDVEEVLPDFQKMFDQTKENIHAEIYRGADGIKAVWEDMLHAKIIQWIGSGNYMPDQYPIFYKHWNTEREKRKIAFHHLFRADKRNAVLQRKFQQVKFLPEAFNGNPTATCIWDNKVGQFLFGNNLFAFVIESEELAENYRIYFKYLWDKVAKP